MEIINDKLYNWASDIDPEAIRQAERTARLPFVERVALMPDAHVGLGATVGSVIATNGAIVPASIGVDVGCGLDAVRLDIDASSLPDDLRPALNAIESAIPAGVGEGHAEISRAAYDWYERNRSRFASELTSRHVHKLLSQFGTLGSGNHFASICIDTNDGVWFVLHSGSRGLGNLLASDHIKRAKELNALKGIKLEDPDLAYFTEDDEGYRYYVADLLVMQDYARDNRGQMLRQALRSLSAVIPYRRIVDRVSAHHNYTVKELHGGREVWVTRKGAIRAGLGDRGIIPIAMGGKVYIVSGKGNPDSFCSCSHGAGRRLSRGAAKREFDDTDLKLRMRGKVWNENRARALVDEIPDAYKAGDVVMADQEDLITVDHELTEVVNFKGA